jgi:hypothetical protein
VLQVCLAPPRANFLGLVYAPQPGLLEFRWRSGEEDLHQLALTQPRIQFGDRGVDHEQNVMNRTKIQIWIAANRCQSGGRDFTPQGLS